MEHGGSGHGHRGIHVESRNVYNSTPTGGGGGGVTNRNNASSLASTGNHGLSNVSLDDDYHNDKPKGMIARFKDVTYGRVLFAHFRGNGIQEFVNPEHVREQYKRIVQHIRIGFTGTCVIVFLLMMWMFMTQKAIIEDTIEKEIEIRQRFGTEGEELLEVGEARLFKQIDKLPVDEQERVMEYLHTECHELTDDERTRGQWNQFAFRDLFQVLQHVAEEHMKPKYPLINDIKAINFTESLHEESECDQFLARKPTEDEKKERLRKKKTMGAAFRGLDVARMPCLLFFKYNATVDPLYLVNPDIVWDVEEDGPGWGSHLVAEQNVEGDILPEPPCQYPSIVKMYILLINEMVTLEMCDELRVQYRTWPNMHREHVMILHDEAAFRMYFSILMMRGYIDPFNPPKDVVDYQTGVNAVPQPSRRRY